MQTAALERLRASLPNLEPLEPDEAWLAATFPDARRAAILALFYPRDSHDFVVLTRRTAHLRSHSGQISFPGGRIDPHDFSPAQAALRETREELGVAVDHLKLYGPLLADYDAVVPHFVQASNSLILPFVAFEDAAPVFVPNPAEVAEVIEVPFGHLLRKATVEQEVWSIRGERRLVGFYRFGQHKIWGATARILRQLIRLSGGPEPPPNLVPPGETEPTGFPMSPASPTI